MFGLDFGLDFGRFLSYCVGPALLGDLQTEYIKFNLGGYSSDTSVMKFDTGPSTWYTSTPPLCTLYLNKLISG